METKINFIIPDEIINDARLKINEVLRSLAPYLIALKPAERLGGAKMSDKTQPLVENFGIHQIGTTICASIYGCQSPGSRYESFPPDE